MSAEQHVPLPTFFFDKPLNFPNIQGDLSDIIIKIIQMKQNSTHFNPGKLYDFNGKLISNQIDIRKFDKYLLEYKRRASISSPSKNNHLYTPIKFYTLFYKNTITNENDMKNLFVDSSMTMIDIYYIIFKREFKANSFKITTIQNQNTQFQKVTIYEFHHSNYYLEDENKKDISMEEDLTNLINSKPPLHLCLNLIRRNSRIFGIPRKNFETPLKGLQEKENSQKEVKQKEKTNRKEEDKKREEGNPKEEEKGKESENSFKDDSSRRAAAS